MSDPSLTCFHKQGKIFGTATECLFEQVREVLNHLSTLSNTLSEYETGDGMVNASIQNAIQNVETTRKYLGVLKPELEKIINEETMAKNFRVADEKAQKFKSFAGKHGIPYNSMTHHEMAAAWDAIEKENIRNKFFTTEPEQKQGITLFGGPSNRKIYEPDTAYGVTPSFQTTSTLFGGR